MEFHFRANDGRSPRPPPFFNNLSEPPFPAPSPPPVYSFPSMSHYSNNGRDLFLGDREREMMIRDEIIFAEIARRREIELEVRRDIMFLEREMASRRAGFSFDYDSGAMPTHIHWPSQLPPPPPPPPPPHWSSSPSPMPMMPPHSFVGPQAVALPPRDAASNLNASPVANSDKLIVLDRPNPDVIETKRKAIEPPPTLAANEQRLVGSKKKPKSEWSCAICQVTAAREKALNAHLQGKKHKAKVERLKIQNLDNKNVSNRSDSNMKAKLDRPNPDVIGTKRKAIEPPPTLAANEQRLVGSKKKPKAEWSCAICQVTAPREKVLNTHLQGKKHKANVERLKIQNLGNKNVSNCSDSNMKAKLETGLLTKNEAETVSNKYKIVPENKSKDKVDGDSKNTDGSEAVQQESGTKGRKKRQQEKFPFWCEMCQRGSYSSQVMEDHKRGKKHMAKLLAHSKRDEAAIPNHISPEVSDVYNLENEPYGMLLKTIIVPKPEALEVVYNLGKCDEAASLNIVPKIEKPDVDGREVLLSGVNSEGKA